MTQKNRNGLLLVVGFVAGLLVGTWLAQEQFARLRDENEILAATLRRQIGATDTCLHKMQDFNRVDTLIFDPAPATHPAAVQVLAGLLGIPTLPAPVSQRPGAGNPRWLIPGRVKPFVVGDHRGVSYYYFDVETRKQEGPFIPRVIE